MPQARAFSILTRIDAPVTTFDAPGLARSNSSFSILTRIDAPVTNPACVKIMLSPPDFQYPHTDRCPCNTESHSSNRVPLESFSILTRIDAPVTRVSACRPSSTTEAFSILTRIDAPVTSTPSQPRSATSCFQYPHTDRCPCNPLLKKYAYCILMSFQYPHTDRCPCNIKERSYSAFNWIDFQYPHTDRCPCNTTAQSRTTTINYLSVSSHGSMPL